MMMILVDLLFILPVCMTIKSNTRAERELQHVSDPFGEYADYDEAANKANFSLRWLNETSIQVTFPDNSKTEVKLSRTSSFGDDPTPCLFEGSLGEDNLVDVTVFGCRGEETEVTINSIKWGIHDFVLRTSGEMEEIQEDPNYHGKEEEELLPPSKGGFEPDFPDYTPEEPRYLESNFSLRWLNETSMEVTYPDNSKIEVKLSPTSNFDEPTPCLFMGSLGEDANGDVVVIGCLGEETEVTINSIKWGIHNLVLRTNGETYEIEWNDPNHGESGEELLPPSKGGFEPLLLAPQQVESDFSLRWLTETSMEVTFPDTSTTEVELAPTSSFGDEPTPCLFEGSFGDEGSDSVLVIGCLGEETQATLSSLEWGTHYLTLKTDGLTYEVVDSVTSRTNTSETSETSMTSTTSKTSEISETSESVETSESSEMSSNGSRTGLSAFLLTLLVSFYNSTIYL